MTQLFDKCGGYRALHSFTYATLIHLGTIAFCKRFISFRDDPLGKTTGQMIGAARSGRQNIIEGSERSATSKETEIKLTDVARASLSELLGDLEIFLAERGAIPWSRHSDERRHLFGIQIEPFAHTDDELHDYWTYFASTRANFKRWLDSEDAVVVANALIVLIERAMAMLAGQVRRLGEDFEQRGGFRERLHQRRVEVRDCQPGTPTCPECGKPMRLRKAHTGAHAGEEFWGCTGYPNCKATRPKASVGTQDAGPGTQGT